MRPVPARCETGRLPSVSTTDRHVGGHMRVLAPHGAVTLCCRRIPLRAACDRYDDRPSRSGGEWIHARRYLGLALSGGAEVREERAGGPASYTGAGSRQAQDAWPGRYSEGRHGHRGCAGLVLILVFRGGTRRYFVVFQVTAE